jgi:hypothetical protein
VSRFEVTGHLDPVATIKSNVVFIALPQFVPLISQEGKTLPAPHSFLFCIIAILRKESRFFFCIVAILRKESSLFCIVAILRKESSFLFCIIAILRKESRCFVLYCCYSQEGK